MVVKQAQLDSVKGNFVLEKDTAYQEVGNYFYPTQTVEKNIGRSFLRGQVNEQGEMSLTSIYCAGGTLHHTAVKVPFSVRAKLRKMRSELPAANTLPALPRAI